MATPQKKVIKRDTLNKMSESEEEQAVTEAEEDLPPPGYQRNEESKKRSYDLQREIDRMAGKMMAGTIDAKSLEICNEIANKTQYLAISGAKPGRVYGWISTNRYMQHVQALKLLGWETIQGDDPEALELKGTDGSTVRKLGDVILMWIPEDRYIVLKAREQAKTKQIQQASSAGLVELGEKYRNKGFIVRPYRMDGFEGPPIQSRVLSRKQAMNMVDRALRDGTVPGMYVGQ